MIQDSLDYSHEEFKDILDKATDLILATYESLDEQRGYHHNQPSEVASWFDQSVPAEGTDFTSLLSEVKSKVYDTATGNLGQHMYAYVMSGGNQISTVAEMLMSTINQNNTKWHLAPSMAEIEKRVISWTTEIIGFTASAGGAMVSGGSEANLSGLTVARNMFFKKFDIGNNGLFGMKPFIVYCSTEAHNSIDKSTALLGIGSNHIHKIPTHNDLTINVHALETQIIADIAAGYTPFCIVGNAGTVNTGAIDDLEALADIAKKYHSWFHIDGAYGGLASTLPSLRIYYKGIERADSIALDFHKWLYQPFEIGCFLVRDWEQLRETYFKPAAYLGSTTPKLTNRTEFNEHYFQLSRNAKAFKVWMSIKAYGLTKIKQMIQKDMDLTHYLADLIKNDDDFELISETHLAIVCFRYVGNLKSETEIEHFTEKLMPALEEDGAVFITSTKIHGKLVIRACLINHRKTKSSIDYLLDTIRRVAKTI
jgi:aromatic-L-amino-acid/L-tryptophan decarboxylase